jgi:hypothetical protein
MKKIKKYDLEDNTEEIDYVQVYETNNIKLISRIINNNFSGMLLTIVYR